MTDRITYIESRQFDPYVNLAVEEYLLLHCEADECILYLWQNQNTIVVGRNQNAWRECRVEALEQDGGRLARRLSGGGAVYHDLGNLNFTFIVRQDNYDLDRQMEVIVAALKKLGIRAEKSGRNDVLVDGRKVSGNAYYRQGDRCYHHGTLMVSVNLKDLGKYLTVSKEKLQSKGVASVRSRVANLTEFLPELTIDRLKETLRSAFEQVYGLPAKDLRVEDLCKEELEKTREKYASWDWLYGRKLEFTQEFSHRFSWGEVQLQLMVDGGMVTDVQVYCDALDAGLAAEMMVCLKGCPFRRADLSQALCTCTTQEERAGLLRETAAWILEWEM